MIKTGNVQILGAACFINSGVVDVVVIIVWSLNNIKQFSYTKNIIMIQFSESVKYLV